MTRLLVASLLLWSTVAAAEPIVLRMATQAPEGTAWAREGHALERDIAELTHGDVRMHWYLSGVAGDEMHVWDRIKREQLDGIASGGMLCQKLAPSMRALRIPGLFQNRDEAAYVAGRLKETLDGELGKAGFVNLGEILVGPDVIFSRTPIASMADLDKTRLWIWDLDEVYKQTLSMIGLNLIPRELEKALGAYEAHELDGFIAVPTAALAFQWSAASRYFTDLRPSFLVGCLLLSSRAYDQLPVDGQQAVKQAAARVLARLDAVGRAGDEQLLGSLFEKQGLKRVDVTPTFRAEFFSAAQAARERSAGKLVSESLIERVLAMLADFRAMHPSGAVDR